MNNDTTYWVWVRLQDGTRLDVGNNIPFSELNSILSRYRDNSIYKNIFYGRNE